jgi:hypothetical protein
MEIAAVLLLFVGFAAGYAARELVSRRRRAAAKRQYLERKAAEDDFLESTVVDQFIKTTTRSRIETLANAVGARTHGGF